MVKRNAIELEEQAKLIFGKLADERKRGIYKLIEPISLPPSQIPFIELHESRYRNAFECSECENSIILCAHNPVMNGTPEERLIARNAVEEYGRKRAMQYIPFDEEEPTKPLVIEAVRNFETPVGISSRRGKPRSTNVVTPGIIAIGKARVGGNGETVGAVAKDLNVNPNEFSIALKAAGVEIRKGRK